LLTELQENTISYHLHYFRHDKNCRAKLSLALFQAWAELQGKTITCIISGMSRTAGQNYQLSLALFRAEAERKGKTINFYLHYFRHV
jgi:hypothetical protein